MSVHPSINFSRAVFNFNDKTTGHRLNKFVMKHYFIEGNSKMLKKGLDLFSMGYNHKQ